MARPKPPPTPCAIAGCDRTAAKRGWCLRHYIRWWHSGDPAGVRRERGTGTYSRGYHLLAVGAGKQRGAHILIAEKALGRPLRTPELVHHGNGDKSDNRPDNLVICPNDSYHMLLHARMRAMAACGNPDWRKCRHCKKYDEPANLKRRGHPLCELEYQQKRRKMRAHERIENADNL